MVLTVPHLTKRRTIYGSIQVQIQGSIRIKVKFWLGDFSTNYVKRLTQAVGNIESGWPRSQQGRKGITNQSGMFGKVK